MSNVLTRVTCAISTSHVLTFHSCPCRLILCALSAETAKIMTFFCTLGSIAETGLQEYHGLHTMWFIRDTMKCCICLFLERNFMYRFWTKKLKMRKCPNNLRQLCFISIFIGKSYHFWVILVVCAMECMNAVSIWLNRSSILLLFVDSTFAEAVIRNPWCPNIREIWYPWNQENQFPGKAHFMGSQLSSWKSMISKYPWKMILSWATFQGSQLSQEVNFPG